MPVVLLLASGGPAWNTSANAQSIQPIYSFPLNGEYPYARLTLGPDGNFYGTTSQGGSSYSGTVFKVTTNGVLTTLHSFGPGNYNSNENYTNFDGMNPEAALTLGPDGNFYGTTEGGGTNGSGTVFRVTTNGVLTTIHSFGPGNYNSDENYTNSDGAEPYAGLTLGPDGNFYGTTEGGGTNGVGTVFQVTTNGVLTTLHSFSALSNSYPYTNSDGAEPYAGLTLGPDGNFYGTAYEAGSGGYGTVFQVTTNGALTTLANFDATNGLFPQAGLTLGPDGNFYGTTTGGGGGGTVFQVTTNRVLTSLYSFTGGNDGGNPTAGLTFGPDGNFYGTTEAGGGNGTGTVFEMTTNGALVTLHSFSAGIYNNGDPTRNADGENPYGGLTLGPDGNFYGTTEGGGSGYDGTVFQVTTNGALTTLVSFPDTDGGYPQAGLALGPAGNFYGTAEGGGNGNEGTVFQVTTNGVLTILHSFSADLYYTNADGVFPDAGLTHGPDGDFYGTTYEGGSSGYGTVFEVTTNGALTTLANFASTNGANPMAVLTPGPNGNFYGTTVAGGSGNDGTVFEVATNGALTMLHSFSPAVYNGSGHYTNSDGAYPEASLTLGPDGNFYGTTEGGGSNGEGTVFKVTADGALTTLHSFSLAAYSSSGYYTNSDGAYPEAGLTLGPDGNFYGTTEGGGSNGGGTMFKVTANGGVMTLVNFAGTNGAGPQAGLTLGPDGNFYGTTSGGGSVGYGTVFEVTTNGILTTLYSFSGEDDGGQPEGSLALGPDGNFYGTTEYGGSGGGNGVVYRLNLPPEIIQQPAGQLVHPGNEAGFAVTLFGTAPYAFQWLSNNIPIAAATNSTLNIPRATAADDGGYSVIITNDWGSITSSVANLTVAWVPIGGYLFDDTFDPTIASGFVNYYGGDSTNGSSGVVAGVGVNGSAAFQIQSSFIGPNGYGYYAGQWQDDVVPANTDTKLGDYVLSFDAWVSGDVAHQNGGGFSLQVQETAGQYFSTPFPQGQLLTYQPYQGGADLMVSQDDVWQHFAINLAGTTFNLPDGTNQTFNPTGGTWQINFQINAGDWGAEPQTNSTLVIDNLALNLIVPPAVAATPVRNTNGSVTLNLVTSPDISSRLYWTTNLAPPIVWRPIYTNLTGGIWQFTDTNTAGMRAKFYLISTP